MALDGVLKARGWSVPDIVKQPQAYLAALLRDVDPADRPGAYEEARREEELARRAWIFETTYGEHECPHGQPGGDLVHPLDGHMACPLCRRRQSLQVVDRVGDELPESDAVDEEHVRAGLQDRLGSEPRRGNEDPPGYLVEDHRAAELSNGR